MRFLASVASLRTTFSSQTVCLKYLRTCLFEVYLNLSPKYFSISFSSKLINEGKYIDFLDTYKYRKSKPEYFLAKNFAIHKRIYPSRAKKYRRSNFSFFALFKQART